MVDSTVALGKLWDLLVEEAELLSSVSDHVDEVRRQLNTMHSFLEEVDKRKDRNSSMVVRNWINDLRELSIQADAVLEMYMIKVMSRGQGVNLENILERFTCILGKCMSILGECLSMHEIGNEIDGIRSRMADLVKRAESLTTGESSSSPMDNQIEWSRRTYNHGVEENFVGMKEAFKHLSFLVKSDERKHRLISLYGMGGLGKTTLARKIYQDEDVQHSYSARAWVCVSQKFQRRDVFQEVLKQLLGHEGQGCENLSEDELVRKLYKVQMEKKCLVVLDDIWKVEHWNILKCGFPYAEAPCKVLLTSRTENITEYNFELPCLSKDEGWELLQKIALPTHHKQELNTTDSKSFEEIGWEIVSKCGCLPLAISVIGGILRQENNLSEWKEVHRNIDSYLLRGKGVEGDKRVTQVLDLSYNALPYQLKPCFLYLGCFSEDEDIETEWLFELWIAEGMISSKDRGRGEVLRDVAERYLWELASRCMVQVDMDEESAYNRFKSCRLHDLMRELCLSKGKEEEFLKVVDNQEGGQNVSSIERTPRLVCYSDNVQDNIGRNPNLRSLLVLSKYPWWPLAGAERHLSIDFGMFKRLKILTLVGVDFENGKLPKGIEKLILLKHLRIEGCDVDALPPSLFNLPCLQSLALPVPRGTLNLPNSLCNMRRLRYLLLPFGRRIIGDEKLKLDGLSELETLIDFDSETDDVTHLPKLENLRILEGHIQDDESLSIIVDYVWNHQDQLHETRFFIWGGCNINSQEGSTLFDKLLMCKSLHKLGIFCRLRKLSIAEPERCRNLLSLEFLQCEIEEDPMEILGELPMLRTLNLGRDAFVGEKMICRAAGFPQLRKLDVAFLPNLVEWTVEEKAMPHLFWLWIGRCKKLEMIPDGLKFITALKDIRIGCMPKQFVDRVLAVDGEVGADWDKIKHVPSIQIYGTGKEV